MAIGEGRWDCPSCGSRGIYGRHVDCPGCGKPRPAGIKFYLTDDAPVITDAARLREATAGPDWICQHCGATTRATETDCDGCGAPRGSSPTQRVIDYQTADVPRTGDAPPPAAIRPTPPPSTPTPPPSPPPPSPATPLGLASPVQKPPAQPKTPRKPPSARDTCLGCGCLTAVVLIGLTLLAGLIQSCSDRLPVGGEDLTPAMVTGKRWERSFLVEQRRVETGRGWDVPDSAEVVRTERRRRGWGQAVDHYESVTRRVQRSRQVPVGSRTATREVADTRTRTREVSERVQTGERTYVCGQRDLGNGYFEDIECTEPVYGTRSRTESYEEPTTRTESYEETVYRTEHYWENETTRQPVYRRVAVYDTFFTYRAATWDSLEVRRARGDTTQPAWPDTTLRPDQRIRRRQQEYRMGFLRAGGTPFGMRVDFPLFTRFRVGQRVALREDRDAPGNTAVLPADSLSACRRWHRGRGDPPADSLGCTIIAEAPGP